MMGVGFPSSRGDIRFEEAVMSETRREFDEEFKAGAVQLVGETGETDCAGGQGVVDQRGQTGQLVRQE